MTGARTIAIAIGLALTAARASAQPPTRVAILLAEDRRAPDARDLATIRTGMRSRDPETARIAIRAMGRLERPDLVPDLVALLKSPLAEIRAEAANAIGQAAQGWKASAPPRTASVRRTGGSKSSSAGPSVDTAAATLTARLHAEEDGMVRGALCQAIGRLPFTTGEQVQQAESTLSEALAQEDSTDGRLGIAQGLESLVRINQKLASPSSGTIARLVDLASGSATNGAARVKRLALEALIAANAVRDQLLVRAAGDSDAQLRRLAMRAAVGTGMPPLDHAADVLKKGLADAMPMVRLDALRGEGLRGKGSEGACSAAVAAAAGDHDARVRLYALDQLAPCATSADAVALLERTIGDSSQNGSPRGWHAQAHAFVALAGAAPDKARAALPQFVGSPVWQVRMYAARAAAVLDDRASLEKLAADDNDNVCEAAIVGLSRLAGHGADALYVAALSRHGYQAVREAARALNDSKGEASTITAALKAALDRLNAENRDNSRDARTALADALESLGARAERPKPVRELPIESDLTAADLRRFASARARVTMRGGGAFELALFASQAPATVIRFAHLAESGYYNGLSFHRVVPNFVIQGGSPGANEYVGDASYMRDEVGSWPHVRGAVGISTRGRDTGDAQIFIDLVDNARLDHEYTVFAQVLRGMETVDSILEGDVIEKVAILAQ